MRISDNIRAAHENMSMISWQFIEHACQRRAGHLSTAEQSRWLPEWMRRLSFPLQQWPTFVGAGKLREIRRTTEEVTRLIKSVPERIFDNDPQRIASFYGFPNPHLAALILQPPNGIQGALARCDFVDTEAGLKCLEVNMSAFLGGWQSPFWAEVYHHDPVVADFLAVRRLSPTFHDTLRSLFIHLVEDARELIDPALRELNIALVVSAQAPLSAYPSGYFNEVYAEILAKQQGGLSGRVVFCLSPDDLVARQARLYHREQRIHAVVEYTPELTSESIYRCFKADLLRLYNGPLRPILGDKRNLALLSAHADSDRFDDAERAIIRAHIPWTREVTAGETSHAGETVSLPGFLLAHREALVLKAAFGSKGKEVQVGRHTPPEVWERLILAALKIGGWVVQEHVESRPYLYLHDQGEPRVHDVVWGLFCLGASYGGGFLRMLPKGAGEGIINSDRGATEGFIFEV